MAENHKKIISDRQQTKHALLKEISLLHNTIAELERKLQAKTAIENNNKPSDRKQKLLSDFASFAIDSLSDGAFLISKDASLHYVNQTACKQLGYTEEELLRMRVMDFNPHLTQEIWDSVWGVTVRDKIQTIEVEHLTKDGRIVPFEVLANYIELYGEQYSCSFTRDITERKHAEQALQRSEEKYRLVVENANDAIFIAQDGMIKFPNRRVAFLTGYSHGELISRPFRDFISREDVDMVTERHLRRLKGENIPATYSFRILNKTGEILWVETSVVLITWEGRPATLNFLRDITVQKKLEEQLLQAQKMEAVGQLAGGVAHDFNNLLTAIIGYGHLLKSAINQDDRLSAYAGQILSAAERAAILINDLLTFSRKQLVNLQPVNLNEIIRNMESLLVRVIGEDVEFSTILTEEDLIILADSTQIDQILMNLVTNALDAMPKGGSITIKTDRMELDGKYISSYGYGDPGHYAILSVEDTGTGMDESIRDRIFEPFFTTKDVGKGTGLGLSMVYGIVKQHGGYINVYSEPGSGSVFKILLPLVQSEVQEMKPKGLQALNGGTETILIGEDDPQVRNLLKEVLSHAGYNVIEAFDGVNAVEVFLNNRDSIHLLVLDVIMPRKNGKEAFEEITKVKPETKAIFVSGYSADIIHKKSALNIGVNFISKPVSPEELLLTVRNVLNNK